MLSVATVRLIIITQLSLIFVQFVLESTRVQRPVCTQLADSRESNASYL